MITTLLILMILALLTNFYMRQARHQVQLAFGLQSKAMACERAQWAFQAISTTLLSNISTQLDGQPASSISHEKGDKGFWNYFNQPFDYKGSTVQLQDLAGLIPLDALGGSKQARYLIDQGADAAQIARFITSLRDWEDEDNLHRLDGAEADFYTALDSPRPRNNTISSVYETRLIKDYPVALDQAIENGHVTILPQGYFNPLTAPLQILVAFLDNGSVAEEIDLRRQQSPISGYEFTSLTGIHESPYVLFTPSSSIRVKVIGSSQNARCTEEWIINLRGNSKDTFTLRAVY